MRLIGVYYCPLAEKKWPFDFVLQASSLTQSISSCFVSWPVSIRIFHSFPPVLSICLHSLCLSLFPALYLAQYLSSSLLLLFCLSYLLGLSVSPGLVSSIKDKSQKLTPCYTLWSGRPTQFPLALILSWVRHLDKPTPPNSQQHAVICHDVKSEVPDFNNSVA